MTSYYQYPIKCLNCGLHFLVCSDHEDWPNYRTLDSSAYCPECGSNESTLQFPPRETEGFIFQTVPGKIEIEREHDG